MKQPQFADVQHLPHVALSLTEKVSGEVHDRSGLNWGQRDGRERNQAYIPIFMETHQDNPEFFPPREVPFTMYTDDGEVLQCVIAQDNNKAIETYQDNSILGRYFRARLGVQLGQKVKTSDLRTYGRSDVTIYKIDDTHFFMDFDPARA